MHNAFTLNLQEEGSHVDLKTKLNIYEGKR